MILEVYFKVDKNFANSGRPALFVTRKPYYDKHKCLYDGHDKKINKAMKAAGFSELMESVYEFPNNVLMSDKEIIETLKPNLEMIPLKNFGYETDDKENEIRREILDLSNPSCQLCEEERIKRLMELTDMLPDDEYDEDDYYDEEDDGDNEEDEVEFNNSKYEENESDSAENNPNKVEPDKKLEFIQIDTIDLLSFCGFHCYDFEQKSAKQDEFLPDEDDENAE